MKNKKRKNMAKMARIQDRRRVDSIRVPEGPRQFPDKVLTLRVTNEFFTAKAEWRRISNVWSCLHADPELKWMIGLTRDQAMIDLLKRGCKWQCIPFFPVPLRKGHDPSGPSASVVGRVHKQTTHEILTDPRQTAAAGDGVRQELTPSVKAMTSMAGSQIPRPSVSRNVPHLS